FPEPLANDGSAEQLLRHNANWRRVLAFGLMKLRVEAPDFPERLGDHRTDSPLSCARTGWSADSMTKPLKAISSSSRNDFSGHVGSWPLSLVCSRCTFVCSSQNNRVHLSFASRTASSGVLIHLSGSLVSSTGRRTPQRKCRPCMLTAR